MVIFLNLDGSARAVTQEHLYQGSNNVTEVVVVAPFSGQMPLHIAFRLPDGITTTYELMRYIGHSGTNGTWQYTMRSNVLAQSGELEISINARTDKSSTTSYICKLQVEESILADLPDVPDEDTYDVLAGYIIDHTRTLQALAGGADAEAKTREDADTALGSRVDAEANARLNADESLDSRINSAVRAMVQDDTALGKRIDAANVNIVQEAANRAAADTVLETKIDKNNTSLSHSIGAEEIARKAADNNLNAEIAEVRALATNRSNARVYDTKADMDVWLAVAVNKNALRAGDNLLIRDNNTPDYWWDGANPIEMEVNKVFLEDYYTITQTEALVNEESASRQALQTLLQSEMSTEQIARTANDTTLLHNLNAEKLAREAKDTELNTKIKDTNALCGGIAFELDNAVRKINNELVDNMSDQYIAGTKYFTNLQTGDISTKTFSWGDNYETSRNSYDYDSLSKIAYFGTYNNVTHEGIIVGYNTVTDTYKTYNIPKVSGMQSIVYDIVIMGECLYAVVVYSPDLLGHDYDYKLYKINIATSDVASIITPQGDRQDYAINILKRSSDIADTNLYLIQHYSVDDSSRTAISVIDSISGEIIQDNVSNYLFYSLEAIHIDRHSIWAIHEGKLYRINKANLSAVLEVPNSTGDRLYDVCGIYENVENEVVSHYCTINKAGRIYSWNNIIPNISIVSSPGNEYDGNTQFYKYTTMTVVDKCYLLRRDIRTSHIDKYSLYYLQVEYYEGRPNASVRLLHENFAKFEGTINPSIVNVNRIIVYDDNNSYITYQYNSNIKKTTLAMNVGDRILSLEGKLIVQGQDVKFTQQDRDRLNTLGRYDTIIDSKVSKEQGKGLSSNDFTNELKSKVEAGGGITKRVSTIWEGEVDEFSTTGYNFVSKDCSNIKADSAKTLIITLRGMFMGTIADRKVMLPLVNTFPKNILPGDYPTNAVICSVAYRTSQYITDNANDINVTFICFNVTPEITGSDIVDFVNIEQSTANGGIVYSCLYADVIKFSNSPSAIYGDAKIDLQDYYRVLRRQGDGHTQLITKIELEEVY